MKRRNTYVALLTAYALCNTPILVPAYRIALVVRWPILVFGALIAVGQHRRGRLSGTAAWVGLFAAIAGVSVVWSTDRPSTIFYVVVGAAFLLALDGLLGRAEIGPDELVRIVAVLHVIVIVLSLVFLAVRPGLAIDTHNLRGIVGNSNGLGVLLALTAPALWGWGAMRRRRPVVFLALCVLGPSMVLLSRSRSAVLALIAAALVSLMITRFRTRVVLAYAVVIAIVMVFALGHANDTKRWLVDDLVYKDRTKGDVLSSRRTSFSLTWQSAQRHILVGRGYGVIASPSELNAEGVEVPSVRSAHREVGNSYLGVLEQLGLIGFTTLMVLLWSVLGRVGRHLRRHDRSETALAAIIVGSLVAANFEAYLFAPGAIEALITWSAVVVVVRPHTKVEVPV